MLPFIVLLTASISVVPPLFKRFPVKLPVTLPTTFPVRLPLISFAFMLPVAYSTTAIPSESTKSPARDPLNVGAVTVV